MKILKIELTDKCNSRCIFCERDKAKNGLMPLEMFKGIVDEFPEVDEVQPQFFGEPMLHPQFFEALEFLKQRGKTIAFYTNGSLLNRGKRERLAEIVPERVIFSVEADNKELYEQLRPGLRWETVLQNIKGFQNVKRSETRTIARMCVTEENYQRIGEIKSFWSKIVDQVTQAPEIPKGREVRGEYKQIECRRPWEQLVVKHNGDVVLCCVDWHGEVVVGNVKDGARNVWDGEVFNKARERVNGGELFDLCKVCGFKFVPSC